MKVYVVNCISAVSAIGVLMDTVRMSQLVMMVRVVTGNQLEVLHRVYPRC